jgi:hypothetical protein
MIRKIARIDLKFLDSSNDTILEIKERDKEVFIFIYTECDGIGQSISLDVPTAIKLHKTLRTEINKAKGGQDNG